MQSNKKTPATLSDIDLPGANAAAARILNAQYGNMPADAARAVLQRMHEHVWDDAELHEIFDVGDVNPPFANVTRKSDGVRGSVAFIDSPRLYFAFHPEQAAHHD
jgi:hypothetical protein